jgi:hypothetical protein
MSVHHLQRGQVARPARQASQAARVAAPIKGIDIRAAASQSEPGTAIFLRNMVPTERGVEIRSGYREWQLGVEVAPTSGSGIRTLVPFESVTNLDADNRLFAVTNEGIWDVTQYDTAPIQKLSFNFPLRRLPAARGTQHTHSTQITQVKTNYSWPTWRTACLLTIRQQIPGHKQPV